jgi:DNA-binding SARP family transcriptional activator
VLLVEPEWIQLNPRADLWLDVAAFERAFSLAQGIPGEALTEELARALQDAVQLYRGDLLEGWYQEWCVYERERLKYMYLAMLDKLMCYCEAHHTYEAGISYGMQILRYDRARERTHRRLMALYYRAGDRVAALRQYERCVAVLNEELNATPAKSTVTLYQQILADQFDDASVAVSHVHLAPSARTTAFARAVARLKQVSAQLDTLQRQVQRDIQALETFDDEPEPADARQ